VLSSAGKRYNLDQSLYSRLYLIFKQYNNKNRPITMLITQYRMPSELCQFPSECFYENRLETHPLVDRRMKHFPLKPLICYDLVHGRNTMDITKSSFNSHEASCIQDFCTMLVTHVGIWRSLVMDGAPITSTEANQGTIQLNDERSIQIQKRIAVITPYQAQVNYLRNQKLPPKIEVMTTDSAQGSEKDIVIISCVRGNGSIGFLDNRSRLNVMITRARYGLYIFGNLTWLSQQDNCWHRLVWDAHSRGLLHSVGEGSRITLPNAS
jgi:superfamily I DNA and/or RNA helicase